MNSLPASNPSSTAVNSRQRAKRDARKPKKPSSAVAKRGGSETHKVDHAPRPKPLTPEERQQAQRELRIKRLKNLEHHLLHKSPKLSPQIPEATETTIVTARPLDLVQDEDIRYGRSICHQRPICCMPIWPVCESAVLCDKRPRCYWGGLRHPNGSHHLACCLPSHLRIDGQATPVLCCSRCRPGCPMPEACGNCINRNRIWVRIQESMPPHPWRASIWGSQIGGQGRIQNA